MLQPFPLALVDIRDRDAREGVTEPVDDLGRLVPDDHDQCVGSGLDRRLEDVREQGSPRDFDEPFRSVVGQLAESTAAPGGGNDHVHINTHTHHQSQSVDRPYSYILSYSSPDYSSPNYDSLNYVIDAFYQ